MQTVYADSLVLLNAAVDYLLLLSAGKLCALPLRRLRMALGALWGGVYALLAVLYPHVFALFTVKLLAGALAVVIAFGADRRTPRALVAFYAVAAAFAGAVYAAASLAGRDLRGGLYLPVSPKMLLLSFTLCYAAVSLVFRRVGKRAERALRSVELSVGEKNAAFTALLDSGNELTDPISGDGVLVAEAEALAPLFPADAPLSGPDVLSALEALNGMEQLPRFRLLTCSCAAAERALLLCFRPDTLRVDGAERRDLVVAVSPNRLCPDGEYRGILPS